MKESSSMDMMDQKMVFISGSIPSSKNSKVATSKGVFHSKTVTKWLREQGIQHYSASKKEVMYYKTKPCVFPVKELRSMLASSESSQQNQAAVDSNWYGKYLRPYLRDLSTVAGTASSAAGAAAGAALGSRGAGVSVS